MLTGSLEAHKVPPPSIQYRGELEKYCHWGNEVKLYRHDANKALKHMKSIDSKVLRDISYDKMQLLQQKCETLKHQQKEKDNLIDYFSNSWSHSLSGDHMAAKELYRIIDSNFTAGSTCKDNDLNHILSQDVPADAVVHVVPPVPSITGNKFIAV